METIKVPDSLSDMNFSHLPFMFAMTKMNDEKKSIDDLLPHEITELNSLFFQKELEYFDRFTTDSNFELLANIISSIGKRKQEPIRQSIEVNGVKYVWQSDYSKQPVSFHRDVAKCKVEEKPLDLLGFCYVEEGMHYNQLDKTTKVVINDRQSRVKALEPHFNLAQYFDLYGFFLESLPVLRLSYQRSQLSRMVAQLNANPNNGNGRIR